MLFPATFCELVRSPLVSVTHWAPLEREIDLGWGKGPREERWHAQSRLLDSRVKTYTFYTWVRCHSPLVYGCFLIFYLIFFQPQIVVRAETNGKKCEIDKKSDTIKNHYKTVLRINNIQHKKKKPKDIPFSGSGRRWERRADQLSHWDMREGELQREKVLKETAPTDDK